MRNQFNTKRTENSAGISPHIHLACRKCDDCYSIAMGKSNNTVAYTTKREVFSMHLIAGK